MSQMEAKEEIIRFEGISKRFAAIQALDNVTFSIAAGEIHAIVGENGAGKSTLMNLLAGQLHPDAGELFLRGQRVHIANPHRARALGIALVYQELNLCPNMSIAANLFLGREPRKGIFFQNEPRMLKEARQILRGLQMGVDPATLVGRLSVAQQQLVETARAVSMEAQIIVMDEPTSALTMEETEILFSIIRRLKAQGLTILFVSHRLEEVFAISDRISVLRDGHHVGTEETKQTSTDRIVNMIIGRSLSSFFGLPRAAEGRRVPALEVRGLSMPGVFEDVGFVMHQGEILGIAGLEGCGRREVARCLFGLRRADSGTMRLGGKEVRIGSPSMAVQAGLGMVPSDRRGEGCLLLMSLKDNIAVARMKEVANFGLVSQGKIQRLAERGIKELNIACWSPEQTVGTLSGGNQQKVILARWLATNPQVLILDEPTRGIDIGAKTEIYNILRTLADQGITILMISSEIPELVAQCDRILVMFKGRITEEFTRADATEAAVMKSVAGVSASAQSN
jgi:ribose transport system ATP-binding protein